MKYFIKDNWFRTCMAKIKKLKIWQDKNGSSSASIRDNEDLDGVLSEAIEELEKEVQK